MKIGFASAECAPFFKTGGLGDVAGSLPKYIQKAGHQVVVFLPYMASIPEQYKQQVQDVTSFTVSVGWRKQYCGIKTLEFEGVRYYFIDNEYYFNRPNVYGYFDDGERFAFFQQAIIESLEKINFIPDLMHVNDYHTAFIPYLLKTKYQWIQAYQSIKTLLTIHNIEFQGNYDQETLGELFSMGLEDFDNGKIEQNGQVNWLKSAIVFADWVNTVSPSYANEIQTEAFGKGLDGILRQESSKVSGILNGIDYDSLNPATDSHLYAAFDASDISGKVENKTQLQKQLGLPISADIPLIGIVSRLTYQKGFHLVLERLAEILQNQVQIIVLGTGDPDFEQGFRYFEAEFPDKIRSCIMFDTDLAQKIYAGADIFLMPSTFEPCGLSQMMAMRYGTLPVVHEIGGLKDTILPFNPVTHEGDGFGFSAFDSYHMNESLNLALHIFKAVPEVWQTLVTRAMTKDFSWETASKHYVDLYEKL